MSTALAHEIKPVVANLAVEADGQFAIDIDLNLEAILARIGSEHEDTDDSPQANEYDRLRQLPPEELEAAAREGASLILGLVGLEFNGEAYRPEIESIAVAPVGDLDLARKSTLRLSGRVPAGATSLVWRWAPEAGTSVLRVAGDDGPSYAAWLQEGQASEAIPVEGPRKRGALELAIDYTQIGFTHILPKGLDHILFVVGLFLLSMRMRPLIWQISAFTVAHTVTLALGITGVVTISPKIVEPLIALSIVYVAVENIITDKLHRWRPAIVFGFGLLHGLGFAGVLTEIGLTEDDFLIGLITFNIGVEAGQLAVVAICLSLVYWFRNEHWYRRRITVPASLMIALVGALWTVERVVA